MALEILPDCRAQRDKRVTLHNGMNWLPIFCANCGADGGMVPEDGMDFAFYLCNSCAEMWAPMEGTYMEPDTEYWKRMKDKEGK